MSYNLFLDDIRFPYLDPEKYNGLEDDIFYFVSAYHYSDYEPFKDEEWIVARTHNDFVKIVEKNGVPKIVAFDHDLSTEHYPEDNGTMIQNTNVINYSKFVEKTGYDSAKWLCDYCKKNNEKFPEHIVHSWNKVGVENIEIYIEKYKKENE